MSPDGAYHLSYDRHNLILTERKTGERTQLTFDGEPDLEYGCYIDIYSQITVKRQGYKEHPQVLWSPDGTRFITYRADRRTTKKLPLIASYADGLTDLRPELYEYPCPFVTDTDEEIPHYSLYIGSLSEKALVKADAPDFSIRYLPPRKNLLSSGWRTAAISILPGLREVIRRPAFISVTR
ncbi:MAG: hypothetical protein V8S58_06160 [Lachnospiraceae bacterium]